MPNSRSTDPRPRTPARDASCGTFRCVSAFIGFDRIEGARPGREQAPILKGLPDSSLAQDQQNRHVRTDRQARPDDRPGREGGST
jgi:hypothetical protein